MRRSTTKILTTHVGALPGPPETWAGKPATRRCAAPSATSSLRSSRRERTSSTKASSRKAATGSRSSTRASRGSSDSGRGHGRVCCARAPIGRSSTTSTRRRWPAARCSSKRRACRRRRPEFATGCAASRFDTRARRPSARDRAAEVYARRARRQDAFLTSTAPASIEVGRRNEYYKSDEEFLYALADALRVEYETIAKAGLLVQIDDAWLPALWDRIGIEMGLAAYKRYRRVRVEALNHALRNVPEEQVRYHLCWGSWHGPHKHDIPLADIVDVMLAVKAQAYLFEAANARHEHEYTLWERVKLPTARSSHPVSSRTRRRSSSIRSSSRSASNASRASSGARTSSRRPTVGSDCAAIRRSRGRSSGRSPKVPRSRLAHCATDSEAARRRRHRRRRSRSRARPHRSSSGRREATDPQLFLAAAVHGASLDAYHIRVGRDASLDEDVGVERSADIARPPLSRVLGARSGARDDAEAPVAHELGRDAFREALGERRAVARRSCRP